MTLDMGAPRADESIGMAYFVNVLRRPKAAFAALPQQSRWVWWVLLALLALLIITPAALSSGRRQSSAAVFSAQRAQQTTRPQGQTTTPNTGAAPFIGGAGTPNAGGGIAARTPNQRTAQATPSGALGSLSQLGSLALPSIIPTQAIPILSAAAGFAGQLLLWSVWGLALMLGSAIGGGRATFGILFKLMLTAALPLALRGVGQLLYLLIGASTGTLGQAGLSGLITLTAENSTSFTTAFLRALLAYADVFQIWYLGLIVIGMMVIARLRLRQAIVTVAAIVLLFALFTAVPMLMNGALG
ncbi:MAG: hypothetical protein WCL57_19575 [Chloroflexota bacterium]|jgi:hypothetical protein